jgi:thymidylate synthase (FAD)
VAISEQSLRYVRLDEDIPFRLPTAVLKPDTIERGRALIEYVETQIGMMYVTEGIDSMESFHEKKQVTSAIRRWAPLGIATEEGWTANIRTIRHVLEQRSAPGAEEEIRELAIKLYDVVAVKCPALFGDYEEDAHGTLHTDFRKV